MNLEAKQGASILGVGAAACAACCAVPVLSFIAAAGLLTTVAYLGVGLVGLLLMVPVVLFTIRRRRRRSTCSPSDVAVTIGAPTRRPARLATAVARVPERPGQAPS